MDLISMFDKGGPVMWVLAGYSLIACSIVIERLLRLYSFKALPDNLEQTVLRHNIPVALTIISDSGHGPEQVISQAILDASDKGVADLARVASRVGSEQLRRMEAGLPTLGWLGNTAPLLGLFGTIIGMISAFQVIESAGGRVDAQALAGGIWEAMITTGAGLAVAIPILFSLHLLEGMVDQRARRMHSIASVLIEGLPHKAREPEYEAIHHMQAASSHAV